MSVPYYADDSVQVHHGDCLDVLAELPDASVDAVVTDPPYGLEFMGKEWDRFDGGQQARWEGRKDATERLDRNGMAAESLGKRLTARPAYGKDSRGRKCLTCGHYKFSGTPCVCTIPDWEVRTGTPPNMAAFQAWCEQWATECLRILKPGGHLLAFGGTRTWHRLACAVEDAGFEIRDSIAWLYGSGFPKSLDVSKAIDRAAGAERDITREALRPLTPGDVITFDQRASTERERRDIPATDDARTWQGWGTAMKPAFEPVVVARKPLAAGTVAANVLQYGTGALNIDDCRVGTGEDKDDARWYAWAQKADSIMAPSGGMHTPGRIQPPPAADAPRGRWPANVTLDPTQAAELDRQSGATSSTIRQPTGRDTRGVANTESQMVTRFNDTEARGIADTGGASRFFPTFHYEPKAPTHERPRTGGKGGAIAANVCANCGRQDLSGTRCECPEPRWISRNGGEVVAHPTVKPLDLMRWLVRLVTPPGGTVLDPFAGSGTTAEACVVEGFSCITVEREADYLPLIVARLTKPIQVSLFGDETA